jgi:TPR repeat protein
MYFLGKIYLKDQDKSNDNQIEDLLEGSAESGFITAMSLLSKVYLDGQLGEKNPGKAVEWLRKAAEQGDAASQEELGDLLFFGNKGVAKDLVEAKNYCSSD